jgi:hypothetical protein
MGAAPTNLHSLEAPAVTRSSEVSEAVSRIARAHRRATSHPDGIADARRDLATAKIAAYVERTIAEAPPLTSEQRDRLVALLRAPGGDRDA